MKENFANQLGYLALAVRLKQINETMVHSARNLYKYLELDIEPNWYLIFKLLKQYECLSITEIAECLRFSHPSVISIVKKMKEKDYLEGFIDPNDSRRKMVKLTDRAQEELPKLERLWKAGENTIRKIFPEHDDFLDKLEIIENYYREESFMQRTLNELYHVE